MSSLVATVEFDRLRSPRGIVTVLLTVAYLFAGALHGLCDLDVTNPSGKSVVAVSVTKDTDISGQGVATEHHCHGCFSVSVPTLVQAATAFVPKVATLAEPSFNGSDLAPSIDTPPPKTLT